MTLILSVPALGFSGLAVAAFVAFVADGSTAEFWFPTKNGDSMVTAWGASVGYALIAAVCFAIAWSMAKSTAQTVPPAGEDPPADAH
ncbi:hypothetical protein [Streptomyces sp. CC208A]|uniref:hypothetical protein n=1 Tax=Streptomyces sp. CC208A TaxID=3044573 RepID=UPI0024A83D54|nr:hypothetical protein [Streptomyces sp. CC208A]